MKFDVSVIQETPDFIALDKPAGLSVHNDGSGEQNVLSLIGPELHLTHRLDKETSGVLIVAKSPKSAAGLMKALQSESSSKFYRAILRGKLNSKTEDTPITWRWAISDKGEGRKNPQGKASDRVVAKTDVEVLQKNKFFTEIRAKLDTGRQHQIRKHAAIAGHPIVGDSRYNDTTYNQKIFDLYKFERMLLHAEMIRFEFGDKNWELFSTVPSVFETLFRLSTEVDH